MLFYSKNGYLYLIVPVLAWLNFDCRKRVVMGLGRMFIHKLNRIDFMIRLKATGNPALFAERIGVSETTLFEYLAFMKELGAPIRYERARKSYYYACEGSFCVKFVEKGSEECFEIDKDS